MGNFQELPTNQTIARLMVLQFYYCLLLKLLFHPHEIGEQKVKHLLVEVMKGFTVWITTRFVWQHCWDGSHSGFEGLDELKVNCKGKPNYSSGFWL